MADFGIPTKHNADKIPNFVRLCWGDATVLCPYCGHGIDPHGTDPGGPCGTSSCECLMSPNGIACAIWENERGVAPLDLSVYE